MKYVTAFVTGVHTGSTQGGSEVANCELAEKPHDRVGGLLKVRGAFA